jgi:CheY-like chemotaxis protein
MKLDDMGFAFPQECLRATLLVSLLSVWVLVGLFYYLNRYARRDYFSIWTGAWLFYAVWLTFSLGNADEAPGSTLFTINQSCVSLSAVFLLWGSLRFLNLAAPRRLCVVAAMFLAVWILASPQLTTGSLQSHLPVFILLGLSSPFAGVCFLRFHKQGTFAGMGLLSLCFLLWVIYIGSFPFAHEHGNLNSAGFLIAAVLQLFIAARMVIVLFREIQRGSKAVQAEIEAVRQEKFKVITTKEAYEHLYKRMLATEEAEKVGANMRRVQQAAAEREHLQALGQMAGDVAHDINNALAPITGYSELLLSTLPNLPDVPRERLQRISRAAENVAQLVAHMREFYRPGSDPNASDNANNSQAGERGPDLKLDPDLPNFGATCRPLRILCIDDEPELRQVLNDVLEIDHHQITVAPGGKEGLDLFRASLHAGEPYEVVITDLGMPDIDGHHVARVIKAESPQTPIIMLTGWGAMMNTDGSSASEADVVLGKPPRAQELSNLLTQITARSN